MTDPTQNEQFRALIAGKTEYRDANLRGVADGFVIAGQRRWVDLETGSPVATLPLETVATTNEQAAAKLSAFVLTGSFTITLDS